MDNRKDFPRKLDLSDAVFWGGVLVVTIIVLVVVVVLTG